MAKKKRHSSTEIAAKLAQADHLAKEGKLQSEIAHSLGVSVMTLHRWRKTPPSASPGFTSVPPRSDRDGDEARRIADLQLENSRLRHLVTDLLLEKMKLEEASLTKRASR